MIHQIAVLLQVGALAGLGGINTGTSFEPNAHPSYYVIAEIDPQLL